MTPFPIKSKQHSWEVSRVKLVGRGFFVDGFLAQVVAAFVLLLHAVHQQQDQEDGEEDAHHAAHNQSWRKKGARGEGEMLLGISGSMFSVFSVTMTTPPHQGRR